MAASDDHNSAPDARELFWDLPDPLETLARESAATGAPRADEDPGASWQRFLPESFEEAFGGFRRPHAAGPTPAAGNAPRVGPHGGRGPRAERGSADRVRDEIYRRLTADSWLDASQIELEVEGGDVTLVGAVESRRSHRLAEDIAASVPGVVHVDNHLRVTAEERGRRRSDEADH